MTSDRIPPPAHHPAATLDLFDVSPAAGLVVTSHHLASNAGCAVLRAGGNAVDAAVAANAVLGVVRPDTCGPGGDLFALIHRPGRDEPLALNSSGRAGSGKTADDLRNAGLADIPVRGTESITVPGCVDGWIALVDELGSFDLSTVLAPAIDVAENGFAASTELADSLARLQPLLDGQDSAEGMYPDGMPPTPGEQIVRPDHGATLRRLAAGGRDAFYLETLGSSLTAATGGLITQPDLEVRQDEWVQPIHIEIMGRRCWTVPPNSQAYIALGALWIAQRILPTHDPTDPAFHHVLVEAYRAAAQDREEAAADPSSSPLDPDSLVSEERLDAFANGIDLDRAATHVPLRPQQGGTMHLVVRDGTGLGVSLIQSNFHGIGAARSIDGTGIFLHNRGAGFNLIPGHVNEMRSGQRPLHTLCPTLWTSAGAKLEMLLGSRGGQYQPQLLLQVAARIHFADQTLDEAIAAPRWVVDDWTGPGHTVRIEDFGAHFADRLRSRGHSVVSEEDWQRGWGPMAAIHTTVSGSTASGDPRVSTSGVATTG